MLNKCIRNKKKIRNRKHENKIKFFSFSKAIYLEKILMYSSIF